MLSPSGRIVSFLPDRVVWRASCWAGAASAEAAVHRAMRLEKKRMLSLGSFDLFTRTGSRASFEPSLGLV